MSAGQVVAAIADLREQQSELQAVGPDERKKWLLELQDWIIDNTEVLADAAVRNR